MLAWLIECSPSWNRMKIIDVCYNVNNIANHTEVEYYLGRFEKDNSLYVSEFKTLASYVANWCDHAQFQFNQLD